jgi:putative transposase
MSEKTSPATQLKYGIEMVCNVWEFPRSSYYYFEKANRKGRSQRGKRPLVSDEDLLTAIKTEIEDSPFQGEGHRKLHARLRRFRQLRVGRNRVLKIMREQKLLSPYRSIQGKENPHDGRITTSLPNVMWGTDASKVFTLEDGWVWFFGVLEHWNGECLGWNISKKGDRFAAIEALTQSIEKVFGETTSGIARGLALRVDHGSQFLSEGFVNQTRYWGIGLSKGFVREPETNGVIERFHRTFKEQIVHGRRYHNIGDFRVATMDFIKQYNSSWIMEKLDYHSPEEARCLYYKEGRNVLKINFNGVGARKGARLLCSGKKTKQKFHRVPSHRKGARLLCSGETMVSEVLNKVKGRKEKN